MPVPDFKTYCEILDRARSGRYDGVLKVDGELGNKNPIRFALRQST